MTQERAGGLYEHGGGPELHLAYSTELSTANWFTAGNKLATSTGDTQTDPIASSDRRYYRVFSPTP